MTTDNEDWAALSIEVMETNTGVKLKKKQKRAVLLLLMLTKLDSLRAAVKVAEDDKCPGVAKHIRDKCIFDDERQIFDSLGKLHELLGVA